MPKPETQEPKYRVTFQALPDTTGPMVPAIIRFRKFLKAALRRYGFRCVLAEELVGKEAKNVFD